MVYGGVVHRGVMDRGVVEGGGVVKSCCMDRGGMMNNSSMMDHWGVMNHWGGVVDYWGGVMDCMVRKRSWMMRKRNRMMRKRRRMMRQRVMRRRSVMRVRVKGREGVTILIQLRLWVVRVLQRVRVECVERDSLATVHLVPELTRELVLVKQGPVRTDEASSMGPVTPIVTHSVSLAA